MSFFKPAEQDWRNEGVANIMRLHQIRKVYFRLDMEITDQTKLDLKKDIEHVKSVQDHLKHLTTLSTGSIIIIVTFIDKVAQKLTSKWLIAISLTGSDLLRSY